MMTGNIATQVLTTVNAPYGADLSAHQLAELVADVEAAGNFNASVFAFYSEVDPVVQSQFLKAMGVDLAAAGKVAGLLSQLSGYRLPLAA
ncbi:hypothetical protein [Sphingomonas crocodyli]|uniref:Uncharacterized protein n=1 Tax=Sphingomonas crocodyli TaxID=1979270 RepID=A0A437LYR7_9SPHN|nr:hypothetical protein [Sphingomonas crocodyli]RVT90569.1 hypothetical protein EOD43_19475 [Sphingomonas crocodyli]